MKQSKRKRYSTGKRISYKHGGPHTTEAKLETLSTKSNVKGNNTPSGPVLKGPKLGKGVTIKSGSQNIGSKPKSKSGDDTVTGGPVGPGISFDPSIKGKPPFKTPPPDVPPPDVPPPDVPPPPPPPDEEDLSPQEKAEKLSSGEVPQIGEAEKVEVGPDADTKQISEKEKIEAATAEVEPMGEAAQGTVSQTDVPTDIDTSTYDATQVSTDVDVEAKTGTVSQGPIEDIQGEITAEVKFATVDAVKAEAAKAKNVEDVLSGTYLVDEVEGKDTTVAATPDAEKQERETILGEAAPDGVAAQITDTVGYEAAKQRPVKGVAAQGAAATMIAETADIPEDIAAAIVEDPATMTAQLDTDPDPVVTAAIAALPQEALVSAQMESLLGGMEDGEIPLWAKPAVAAVNQGMAARGLSVSTVGRDSLFNAIIQSAMPMAQGNAQALQARAAQNLSNQQQANLQQAQQTQQIRMQNLANRQDAASQTAQMSQQMKVMQSQFNQEAGMKSADQQQQTAMANLQNQQQAAVINAQNEQQIAVQNLGNRQQMEVVNLQIEAAQEGANQAAVNQERLAEMQVAADFLSKNAAFKQQMEVANLSNEQQMRLANLSSRNLAESERMSNAEKTELANLNKTMQTNQLQAQIASQMNLAQLNVDQQSAIQNATTKANMDLTKFNAAQQVELANSKFMQTVALTDMNAEQQAIMQNATAMASMDLANLSTRERLAVQNAQNFLAMDMANLNNEQQASMMKAQQIHQRLLSNQAADNASKQFNSASENQTNQFMANLSTQVELNNTQQANAMEQFNTQQENAKKALELQVDADLSKANASMVNSINQFNSSQEFARDQWNTQNAQAVEQSNIAWRRNANTINTAAANQIAMKNAEMVFNMTSQANSFLWQQLRDEANYAWQSGENEENRKAQLYAQAIANEGGSAKNWSSNVSSVGNLIKSLFGG